jgi:hypothetical protein
MTIDDHAEVAVRRRNTRRLRRYGSVAALALAAILATILNPSLAHAATPVGVISDTATPEIMAVPDNSRIELGLRFSPRTDGALSGVQFYQNAINSGVTSASVWSDTGVLLAHVAVDPFARVGWRTIPVDVELEAGKNYTVSVFDSNSNFPATSNVFTHASTISGIDVPANAGVYRYSRSSGFPSDSAGAEGYSMLVDVVFTSATDPANTPPTEPTDDPATTAPTAPAPTDPPSTTPTDNPTDNPTDTPAAGAVYGPDGTHWPLNTPRADAARVVNVAASWSAISAAITANARSTDPVVICVAPGTISGGNGAGSTSKGVLRNIGNAELPSRILVSACNGVGTVKVAAGPGVAFVGVAGVSLIGIDFSAQSVMIRNSEAFGIGYSKVPGLLVTANGGSGVHDVDIVEIVAGPEAAAGAAYDRVEVKSAGGYSIDGLRFAGFYAAPNYKPTGSKSHVDTMQFVTTSGSGTISNVTLADSVLFQSSDQGIMAGANRGGAITHSAFFGGTVGQLRYPMYAGGDPITLANILHGTWSNVRVSDTIVAGSISSAYTFSAVTGSQSTAGALGFAPLGATTAADIDRLAPMPTDARLASIWN